MPLTVTFPNIAMAVQIYLSVLINRLNCQGEKSFSTTACEEPSYESAMRQERLAALTLLCIESDVLRELDYTQLINDFTELRICRRFTDW